MDPKWKKEPEQRARGLEDIFNIFLSASEEKKMVDGFSSVAIREETCASCINIVGDILEELKCRIFSFESEKYGVPHMDMVTPSHAKYCQHFKPTTSRNADNLLKSKNKYSDQAEDECEIEETVSVRKKIVYPSTGNGQQNMKTALFKHLGEGYDIMSIELRKADVVSEPRRRERREEEITILVKAPPSP